MDCVGAEQAACRAERCCKTLPGRPAPRHPLDLPAMGLPRGRPRGEFRLQLELFDPDTNHLISTNLAGWPKMQSGVLLLRADTTSK